MLDSADEILRHAYGPAMERSLNPNGFLVQELAAEHRAREAAMTPEERELRDLKREIADMRDRLDHALRALNGESCGWDS